MTFPTLFSRILSGLLPAMLLVLLGPLLQAQGPNWARVNRAEGFAPTALAIGRTGSLFVGTEREGVFVSRDGGANWRQFFSVDTGKVELLHFHTTGSLFAVFGGNLHCLRDTARQLTPATPFLPFPFFNNRVTALASDSVGRLFLGTAGGRAFRTQDDGKTWVHLNAERPLHDFDPVTHGIVSSISVGPAGEIYAALTYGWRNANSTIVMSANGGISFHNIDTVGQVHRAFSGVGSVILSTAVNSQGVLFCGTDAEYPYGQFVAHTTDRGGSWSRIPVLPAGHRIQNLVTDPLTNNLLFPYSPSLISNIPRYQRTIYRSTDNGVSRPGEFHPQPLAEPDVSLSTHPAPIIQPFGNSRWHRQIHRLLPPARLTHGYDMNDAAPSLDCHYSSVNTTTSCSAP